MMRFRYINIPKLVFQLLRGNYATRIDYDPVEQPQRTTNLYRLLLACLYPFKESIKAYYPIRSKWYMLAACTPTYGQIERVLNYWYDYDNGITITPSRASAIGSMWYSGPDPKVYLYTSATPPVYLGRGGNYTEAPIVNIPIALFNDTQVYNQFIADLNVLTPFYLTYTIKTY